MNSIRYIRHSALLVLLCIFGSGCCTYYVTHESFHHFYNARRVSERTGSIVDGKGVFAVDIVENTRHKYLPFNRMTWNTTKRHHFEFPLDRVPKNAPCFDLFVESDENAKSVEMQEFNLRDVPRHGIIINSPITQFSIARFELPKETTVIPGMPIHLKVHPNDMGMLSLPFTLRTYYKDKLGHNTYTHRRRDYLMVPYKVDGMHFGTYALTWKGGYNVFNESPYHHGYNASTVLSMLVLTPPALVIDIVTVPIVIPAIFIILNSMENLGP